jgi:excisionase family DNA binding protein
VPQIANTLPKTVGCKDLCELFGVNLRTLRRWIAAGKLPPSIRVGRPLRWRLSTILKLIEGCESNGDLRRGMAREGA